MNINLFIKLPNVLVTVLLLGQTQVEQMYKWKIYISKIDNLYVKMSR